MEASRAATVDELRIAYTDTGTSSPAVLPVHGAFANRSYFAPQIARLSPQRRVVALDLRGHGDSDLPPAVSIDDFARDVLSVCADTGLESAVLCGHSLVGAAVACAVARARPDLVRAIVVLDAVLFPPPEWRAGVEQLLTALAGDPWLEPICGYVTRFFDAADPPELKTRVMADVARFRPELARSLVATFLAIDVGEALQAVSCPILYVHAKAPADLARLAERRPDARIGQVVGSGHYLTLVVPDQVTAMVGRFLELVGPNDR